MVGFIPVSLSIGSSSFRGSPMPPLSHVKLTRLAQLEGFRKKEALLHTYIREVIVPGICFRPDCHGAGVELHQNRPNFGNPETGIRSILLYSLQRHAGILGLVRFLNN